MRNDPSPFLTTVRRHPVVAYFILAFALSWGWVLAVALPSGFPGSGEALASRVPIAFVGMTLGPVASSLFLTYLLEGTDGLRALLRALTVWRLAPRYYAAALLIVPGTAFAVLAGMSLVSADYTPAVLTPGAGPWLVVTGVLGGLAAGWPEEIGWTGFAIRRLSNRWNILTVGVVIGVMHGTWHLVAGYWGEGMSYGAWFIPYFALCWIGGLTGLRILIATLYERTGSILVCQLAHASYTGGLLMLWPRATSPAENTLWTGLFAVALFVAATAYANAVRRPAQALGADA